MNPVRERIEYAALLTLYGFLKLLPEWLIYVLLRIFGALFFMFSFRRRTLTFQNLKIVFPGKTRSERFRIAWMSFQNMAVFTGESLLIMTGKLTPERILQMVDAGSNYERYSQIRSAAKHGVIHLTGHLGNWELLAAYGAAQNWSSVIIARKGDNALIDKNILTPIRTKFGNRIIPKKNALLHIVKALKRGEAASFLIDQKTNVKEGVTVKFFGRDVLAVASAAALQIRFHPTIVPAFMVKTGKQNYAWIMFDPVEWSDDGSPEEAQILKLTQHYQTIIETMILKYPEQWFWMHNRFKLMTAKRAKKHRRRKRLHPELQEPSPLIPTKINE
ncbi:MAG: hypothetical protein WC959_10365 [Kiritimatiellales bacterium]